MVEFPIELRHHIVDPSQLGPLEHVGIQGVVALQCVGLAAARVAGDVSPHAKRTDAEAHPRLFVDNHLVQSFNEQVDVTAAPVAAVHAATIAGIAFVVGKFVLSGVRVEIVVHVYGINVVAAHNVAHHIADEFAALGQTRFEVGLTAVAHEPLRVLVIDVVLRQLFCLALGVGHSIRVEPRMQLHAAAVTLVNHELQRVPERLGAFTEFAGQIHAPRLEVRFVEGVGFWANLPHNGINASYLQRVELTAQIGLVLFGGHARILHLPHGVHPRSAKLALWVLGLGFGAA